MFHYKDGLFFGRNEDGSVKIRKMRDATGAAALVAEMDIEPKGWASIVAHVSAEGDFGAAAAAMLEFHLDGILRTPAVGKELPNDQTVRLADFILNEVPGEPSENEGAVDTAIRLIRRSLPPLNAEAEQPTEPASAEASEVVESPPPGAELEQPTKGEGRPPEGS